MLNVASWGLLVGLSTLLGMHVGDLAGREMDSCWMESILEITSEEAVSAHN